MAKITISEAKSKLEKFKNCNSITLFIPEKREFLVIQKGSGANISKEDINMGFNDYLYCRRQIVDEVNGTVTDTDEDAPMYYFNSDEFDYGNHVEEAAIPVMQLYMPVSNDSMEDQLLSQYIVEEFIPCAENEQMKEDVKTMSEKGYDIDGIHLDVLKLEAISNYYLISQTQDYILETYNVSVSEAEKVARKARQLQEDACSPLWDTACVKTAADLLHINLIDKEDNCSTPLTPIL